jgi:hypothetical protein
LHGVGRRESIRPGISLLMLTRRLWSKTQDMLLRRLRSGLNSIEAFLQALCMVKGALHAATSDVTCTAPLTCPLYSCGQNGSVSVQLLRL